MLKETTILLTRLEELDDDIELIKDSYYMQFKKYSCKYQNLFDDVDNTRIFLEEYDDSLDTRELKRIHWNNYIKLKKRVDELEIDVKDFLKEYKVG